MPHTTNMLDKELRELDQATVAATIGPRIRTMSCPAVRTKPGPTMPTMVGLTTSRATIVPISLAAAGQTVQAPRATIQEIPQPTSPDGLPRWIGPRTPPPTCPDGLQRWIGPRISRPLVPAETPRPTATRRTFLPLLPTAFSTITSGGPCTMAAVERRGLSSRMPTAVKAQHLEVRRT